MENNTGIPVGFAP